MRELAAPAKINLALVVGPRRRDGKHELVTVYQRVALCDRIALAPGEGVRVLGFADDTLVARALALLAEEAGVAPAWTARIEKRIPVAAGLGGGSSDAACALRLANETLPRPLGRRRLALLAARLGADVPFFLAPGPQLGEGDGSRLRPLDLPQDYWVLLFLPQGARKLSTAAVYAEHDRRGGAEGFARRRRQLLAALAGIRSARDLAVLPPNDLASSPHAETLRALGAFRADVSGAGPVVYGLFEDGSSARRAAAQMEGLGQVWVVAPAWYG